MCNMVQAERDEFDWTLWTGETPSKLTGPITAYNGEFYLHIEASKPRVVGETAM